MRVCPVIHLSIDIINHRRMGLLPPLLPALPALLWLRDWAACFDFHPIWSAFTLYFFVLLSLSQKIQITDGFASDLLLVEALFGIGKKKGEKFACALTLHVQCALKQGEKQGPWGQYLRMDLASKARYV